MAENLSPEKARKILHDKEVRGHPLTDKQRRYMGWVSGGSKPRKSIADKKGNRPMGSK